MGDAVIGGTDGDGAAFADAASPDGAFGGRPVDLAVTDHRAATASVRR